MNEITQQVIKLNSTSEGREKIARMYRNVFNQIDGQMVLEDLRSRCFCYVPLPLGEEGVRAEGKRQVILTIESQVNIVPGEKLDQDSHTIQP